LGETVEVLSKHGTMACKDSSAVGVQTIDRNPQNKIQILWFQALPKAFAENKGIPGVNETGGYLSLGSNSNNFIS
jgi:hypothetical protein